MNIKKLNITEVMSRVGGVAAGTMAADFVANKLLKKIGNRAVRGAILMIAGGVGYEFAGRSEFMQGAANGVVARGTIELSRGLNIMAAISNLDSSYVGESGAGDYVTGPEQALDDEYIGEEDYLTGSVDEESVELENHSLNDAVMGMEEEEQQLGDIDDE